MLVEDRHLESELRNECVKYLKFYQQYVADSQSSLVDPTILRDLITTKLSKEIPLLDIKYLS